MWLRLEPLHLRCSNNNNQNRFEAADRQAAVGTKGPAFVAAKKTEGPRGSEENSVVDASQGNADEIHISDDEDL